MPRLQPGEWPGYRDPKEIQSIKRAVARGLPWTLFMRNVVPHWPRERRPQTTDQERNLHTAYKYYSYRHRGHARFVNATDAEPHGYTVAQRMQAYTHIANGARFASFWREVGLTWGVPMYRLSNWFHNFVKRWRDIVAASPDMSKEDQAQAIFACATRGLGDGAKDALLVSVVIQPTPAGKRKYVGLRLREFKRDATAIARHGGTIAPVPFAQAAVLVEDLAALGTNAEIRFAYGTSSGSP